MFHLLGKAVSRSLLHVRHLLDTAVSRSLPHVRHLLGTAVSRSHPLIIHLSMQLAVEFAASRLHVMILVSDYRWHRIRRRHLDGVEFVFRGRRIERDEDFQPDYETLHCAVDRVRDKLQALVYDILPSITAVFNYAIGSRRRAVFSFSFLFVCWCSNSSKFVTNNSNYIRRLFYNWPCRLRQLK